MDIFAHAIWSFIIFHQIPEFGWAIFFGVLPDLSSWGVYTVYSLIFQRVQFGKPDVSRIPNWVYVLYGISHSIFVFGIVLLAVFLIAGFVPVFLLAWIIHILIDIPTHSRKFLPTPFLWPISDWKFPGISWGNKWFMVSNYTAIAIALAAIIL